MKVLQINSVCGIGSTGRIATDIHNILIEQGHESYIAYGRDLPKNCDNVIRIGTKIDNYTHVAKTRLLDKHGFGSIQATKEFIEKLKTIDPDVIHLHNIHGYYINIEILFDYLKKADKPVVWTLHDCWSFTGHCSHFDYIGCDKWKTGCFECPQKKEYPKSFFIDNSEWNYNRKKKIFSGLENLTIITPSNWLKEQIGFSFLKNYNVELINNGIDLDSFKPLQSNFREKYNLNNKYIILGVAHNWGLKKGFDYFTHLSEKLSNDEIIILVGVTRDQSEKLPSNVIGILKTTDKNELAEIYSVADIFVNPTLEEVLGLVNIEALACGTPVVTFNTGGSVECINTNSGIIVDRGNIAKLYEAITQIKKFGKEKYSKYCIEQANEKFNKDDRIKDYIRLYKKMLIVEK